MIRSLYDLINNDCNNDRLCGHRGGHHVGRGRGDDGLVFLHNDLYELRNL